MGFAGLNDQTPVTFSDVAKFEKILWRKIAVFYRTSHSKPLSHFASQIREKHYASFSAEHMLIHIVKNIMSTLVINIC